MPLYTKESLEKLREKIDLVEVLSAHLDMKRAGSAYKTLCPFHDEKTPSFMIQRGDTHYHCYGCGAHGDAIQFLMHHLRLGFTEAVEALAERFHVTLERTEKTDDGEASKTLMREALEQASLFFQFYLLHTEEGHEAQAYLFSRGLPLPFIKRFELGLAPKASGLMRQALHANRFSDDILQAAGLIGERKTEFFRERITFPIRSGSGALIGFSARKYKEETLGGKYINTSETPLFKKSRILFGLPFSRRRIVKERRVLIVEGQIDCLRLIEAGLNLAVAPLGTAFGEGHVRELQQLGVRQAYLLFDADEAGQQAASKVGNLLQKVGMEVLVVNLPKGLDPDAFLNKNGPEALLKAIEEAVDYLSFQISHLSKNYRSDSPAGKNELVQQLKTQIEGWDQPIMIHESLRKVASLTHVPEEMLGVGPTPARWVTFKSSTTPILSGIDPHRILELDLLRWLLLAGEEYPEFFEVVLRYLTPEHFWVPVCRSLFTVYVKACQEKLPRDLLSLSIELSSEEGPQCLEEILNKKINREKAQALFLATVQKLLDRQWMREREQVRQMIQGQAKSEAEVLDLVKKFDALKEQRPIASFLS